MIKSIIKANSWYDNLAEPKRTLFFFFVLAPLLFGTQFLLTTFLGNVGYIYWALWIMLVVIFRMVPIFVDIKNKNV
jgi:hypothetical protein